MFDKWIEEDRNARYKLLATLSRLGLPKQIRIKITKPKLLPTRKA